MASLSTDNNQTESTVKTDLATKKVILPGIILELFDADKINFPKNLDPEELGTRYNASGNKQEEKQAEETAKQDPVTEGEPEENNSADKGEPAKTIPVNDLRIKKLSLRNFRKFPKSQYPFTISFTGAGDIPKSLILVGNNASGKSSIYGALEYLFKGDMGEARLRNIEPSEFARHGASTEDEMVLEVKVKQKDFTKNSDVQNYLNEFSLEAFFCSEADIISIGEITDDESWACFFANQLGFKKLTDLLSRLKEIHENQVHIVEEDLESIQVNIRKTKEAIEKIEESMVESIMDSSSLPDRKKYLAVFNEMNENIHSFRNAIPDEQTYRRKTIA